MRQVTTCAPSHFSFFRKDIVLDEITYRFDDVVTHQSINTIQMVVVIRVGNIVVLLVVVVVGFTLYVTCEKYQIPHPLLVHHVSHNR